MSSDFVGSYIIFAVSLGLPSGLISAYVAARKGRRKGIGFLLGFFLSIVGIIITSCFSNADVRIKDGKVVNKLGRELKKCPFCAELILAEASLCLYCHREFLPQEAIQSEQKAELEAHAP